jgi:hypothetical protein
MSKWIALLFLILVCTYVAWRGNRDERFVLAVLVANFVATYVWFATGTLDWRTPQNGVLFTDCLTFLALLIFALRSDRFWPLLIVSAGVMPILTYFVKDVGQGLISYALGLTQAIWGNLQLIILVVAVGARE